MSNVGKIDDLSQDAFDKYKKGSWDVHILKVCTSTFDIAKRKIEMDAQNGTLIIADEQTGGRGRQARKWHSPSNGIWMGVILKANLELSKLSSVTLLCAVAVAKAMEEMFPSIVPSIKWPNDIYINSRKVCGILTETIVKSGKAEYAIVGVGINANNTTEHFSDDVRQTSTSFMEMGLYVNRPQMASLINDNLLELIKIYEQSEDINFIIDYYTSHMHWINKEAVMKNTITGKVAQKGIVKGIDGSGGLLMEIDGETAHIVSGELSLRRLREVEHQPN